MIEEDDVLAGGVDVGHDPADECVDVDVRSEVGFELGVEGLDVYEWKSVRGR
jgi:hypothetical protein